MSEIRQIGHDSAAARLSVAYESILRALGSPHFGTRVHEAALSLLGLINDLIDLQRLEADALVLRHRS